MIVLFHLSKVSFCEISTCYNLTNFLIDDCALPLVKGVVCTDNPEVGFKDVDAAFMVGAMPRREGMERKDLLAANVKIFKVLD